MRLNRIGKSSVVYAALVGLATGCADRPLPTEPEIVRGVARWQTEPGNGVDEPGVRITGPDTVLVNLGTGACGGEVIRAPRSLVVRYAPDVVSISARPFDAADYCDSGEDVGYYQTLRVVLTEPIAQRRLRLL